MKQVPTHELSPRLADAVQALHDTPAAAVEAAQQRLLARLAGMQTQATATPRPRWWPAGAFAALALVVALGVLPLWPDANGAFAAVQARFGDFRSLRIDVTQRVEGEVIQTSRILVDAHGASRTDVGDELSIVADPAGGRMLMLLHGPRQALAMPLAARSGDTAEPLEWVEKIRDFQGRAEPIAGTRRVAGRTLHGWRMETEGMPIELWADSRDQPTMMHMTAPGGLEITFDFAFDVPVPSGALDAAPPPGYRLAAPAQAP